jgi:hypothetical protein
VLPTFYELAIVGPLNPPFDHCVRLKNPCEIPATGSG